MFSYRYALYFIAALSLSLIKASLVFVLPQEVGVVVSIVSPGGVRERPLRGGVRWVVPLAERVVRYPLYWQSYEMSASPTAPAMPEPMLPRRRWMWNRSGESAVR